MSKKSTDSNRAGRDLEDKSSEFTVEKFMAKRYLRGRPQYLAKWEGYSMDQSTWEPLENLGNCMTLVADFEAELFKKSQEKHNTQ
ncbi:chromobox protein homolog 1 [Drosophila yakuba]|uniref:Oxpecker n=1 Tax=Drosophila yakuba TaxID=7245 RepID=B4P565_DROYA|nr:chromobox protein homolog 1 [Drosophila yakuba]EDW91766.1 oxpecker [Drosophila yakuba]